MATELCKFLPAKPRDHLQSHTEDQAIDEDDKRTAIPLLKLTADATGVSCIPEAEKQTCGFGRCLSEAIEDQQRRFPYDRLVRVLTMMKYCPLWRFATVAAN